MSVCVYVLCSVSVSAFGVRCFGVVYLFVVLHVGCLCCCGVLCWCDLVCVDLLCVVVV